MIDLAKTYQWLCEHTSDINEHLPTLYEYGKKVDHITEFGVRTGVSTIAWLCASPEKLVAYDLNPYPPADQFDNFKFIQADVLDVEIEETDLLFIDTYHSYTQLSQELELHGNKAKKYLIFHDTETFGYHGEDHAAPGILAAINEFMKLNSWWVIAERFENNNGLMILKIDG